MKLYTYSLEEALIKLQSTMPGVEILSVEEHSYPPEKQVRTIDKAATVSCLSPVLSTSLRQIGDWTFRVHNTFLGNTLQKIAFIWHHHNGGLRFGEPELIRSLRRIFKRFYAEVLVSVGKPPLGRTLLIESILFESYDYFSVLASFNELRDNPQLNRGDVQDFVKLGFDIEYMHEIGHLVVREATEPLESLTSRHFDGFASPLIARLLQNSDQELAEEIYCDLFALDYVFQDSYVISEPSLRADHAKKCLFSYTILIHLMQLWKSAQFDAACNWDPIESGDPKPSVRDHKNSKDLDFRHYWLWTILDAFCQKQGGHMHKLGGSFYLTDRFDYLLRVGAQDLDTLSESNEFATTCSTQREMARFLTLPMTWADEISKYLVENARFMENNYWAPFSTNKEETVTPNIVTYDETDIQAPARGD